MSYFAKMSWSHDLSALRGLKFTESSKVSHDTALGSLKAVFHFNRIVAKRSVFHCFVNTQAELMIWT